MNFKTFSTIKKLTDKLYYMEYLDDYKFDEFLKAGASSDYEVHKFIEKHLLEQDRSLYLEAARPAVDFFLNEGVDSIVLGCTHFLHIASEIQQLAGRDVQVVDSREGVVRQALRIRAGLSSNFSCGKDKGFFVTGLSNSQMAAYYQELCRQFSIPWGGLLD